MLGDYYNAIYDYRQSATQMEALQDRNGEAVAKAAPRLGLSLCR